MQNLNFNIIQLNKLNYNLIISFSKIFKKIAVDCSYSGSTSINFQLKKNLVILINFSKDIMNIYF